MSSRLNGKLIKAVRLFSFLYSSSYRTDATMLLCIDYYNYYLLLMFNERMLQKLFITSHYVQFHQKQSNFAIEYLHLVAKARKTTKTGTA